MSINHIGIGGIGANKYLIECFTPSRAWQTLKTIPRGLQIAVRRLDGKIFTGRIGYAPAPFFTATDNILIPFNGIDSWCQIKPKWQEIITNIIPNVGLDEILDKTYKGSSYTAVYYVLLTDGTPTVAAADTLASHAGWVEVTDYAGNRKALTLGTVASQSVDNSASKAAFAIDQDSTTIGGAGIATVDTGTSGILGGVGAFTGGDKSADNGDTLNVTITLTQASA